MHKFCTFDKVFLGCLGIYFEEHSLEVGDTTFILLGVYLLGSVEICCKFKADK